MDYVNDHRIALEICLSSNLHTGSIKSLHSHPLRRFLDYGLRVTLNTDNRLFSDTTVSKEIFLAQKIFNLTEEEIKKIVMFGFKSAFMHYRERKKLLLKIADELHTSCL
jgi:adenosine deaminase